MKRTHRRIHFLAWVVLGVLMSIGFIAGIAARQPVPLQEPPVPQQLPQLDLPTSEVPK